MKRFQRKILLAVVLALLAGAGVASFIFVRSKLARYKVVHTVFFPPAIDFYTPPSAAAPLPLPESKAVRNVILLIGDGMGLGTLFLAGMAQGDPSQRLHMEQMPVVGLVRTYSANFLHTDSGAAATAMASGYRTDNDMLSVLPDGREVKTIPEAAHETGMRTGIVVTCDFADDTPAAFLIRGNSSEGTGAIADKIAGSLPDVLFGCRPAAWNSDNGAGEKRFIDAALRQGYAVARDSESWRLLPAGKMLGLFEQRDPANPTLPEMTVKALQALSKNEKDGKGFFSWLKEAGSTNMPTPTKRIR